MGSVVKREGAKGIVWHIVYSVAGKQKWEKVPPAYPGKRGAERFLIERESKKDMIAAGQATFAQVAETWVATTQGRVKPTSFIRYDLVLNKHLLPTYGDKQIQSLKPAEIQLYISRLCETLSVAYVRDSVAFVLRSVLELAVQHELLARSPVPRRLIYPRQEKRRQPHAVTAKEAKRLLEEADPLFYPIFAVGLFAGLRIGEVLGMKWEYLDLEARRYHVHETLTQQMTFQSAKTQSSNAPVALSPYLCRVLEDHQADYGQRRLAADTWGDDTLIFCDEKGRPFKQSRARNQLKRAAKFAGIEGVGLHDLRHSCASLLVQAGADIKTVSEQLRHSSITITMDHYSHLYPEQLDAAVHKLDALVVG